MNIVEIFNNIIGYTKGVTGIMLPFSMGEMVAGKDCITFVHTPAQKKDKYLQGKTRYLNFQVLVKMDNQKSALTNIYNIDDILDDNTSLQGIEIIETYTEPRFVERNDEKKYIYTAMYKCMLTE